MSKVAVTGGAGFLGSHIVRHLVNSGNEVSIIDNLSSGSLSNLKDLGIEQDCIIGDLRNYEFTKESLRGAEVVYHFAAEVGSVVYLHGSNLAELAAMQTNLAIDTNVFRACIDNNIRKIIYASSVSVYPFDQQLGTIDIAFDEEDSELHVNPEGGYGWSKYLAEKQLALMSDVSIGIARIFHAYGENIYMRQDRSQVIASLMRKIITYPNEDFVIWGTGDQRRCFVMIDDVLEALFRLDDYVEHKGSLTVNVGSQEEVTIRQLSELILKISGRDIQPRFDTSKPSGALNRKPNLEKAETTLGWRPKIRLHEGLERTYAWATRRLSNES